MINSANMVVEPGVIRNSTGTQNRFTLGEPDGTASRRVEAISAAFERAGVRAPVSTAIRNEIWEKLLRNLSTSPICAMTGEPIGVISRHPELFELAKGLMAEGLATARAHGIDPGITVEKAYRARPDDDAQILDAAGFRGRPAARDRRSPDLGAGLRPRRRRADPAGRRDHRAGDRKGAAGHGLYHRRKAVGTAPRRFETRPPPLPRMA